MLELRRATVVVADPPWLDVEVGGELVRAFNDEALVGPAHEGDEVIVNVQGRRLELGSGGFDLVHVNLTRGLDGAGTAGAHVMKLNYTPLQHAVHPVEDHARGPLTLDGPVGVLALHGHLPPLAWAFARAAPGRRLGYVQTAGGALPGALSRVAGELQERGLLAGHLTAGAAYGGSGGEALTTAGALHFALAELDWDAVAVGPGPGIVGSGSALGHGGMAALDSAHAALALGCPTLLVARMSERDPRERHRGLSHHTATVLGLLLDRVVVAVPPGVPAGDERHDWRPAGADWDGYRASGLPVRTMGRDDPRFFAAALAAGTVLAGMIPR